MDFFSHSTIQFFIAAYLFGSIPFGLILAKVFAGVDIKSQGSRSVATVILDALKGTLVLLVALWLDASTSTLWGIGVLAVLGHCYSIFLGLEGGKGVATGLGIFIVLIPIPTLIGAVVWGFCAKVLKISSLSSLLGLTAVIISALFLNNGLDVGSNAPMYIIAFIIFYKHIPNIMRLLKKEELKVS
jgi:glycerol-3-phosphate acyltransferase PlsY